MTTEQLYSIFLQNPNISTDTRKITENSIYFALKGETFNGNLFAIDALNKGASYAVIDEEIESSDKRLIKVDDVLQALQQLANYHRKQLAIPVLAITGTNGKTTTKELVSKVLEKKFNLVYTLGNLNNHIGVPLTLLRLTKETEFAVIEMGANHQLEIKHLCEIAEPDFGLITNVGHAHLEGFGSFEGVKKGKGEMYDFLKKKNGLVFINEANEHLNGMLGTYDNKITYGIQTSNLKGKMTNADPFLSVSINLENNEYSIDTQLSGAYNFENVLVAVSIGVHFSVPFAEIKAAIESYRPENNRSQIVKKGSNTLFIDCYNANPSSMKASIENFANLSFSNKLLILGDMFELGDVSVDEHRKILELISKLSLAESSWLVGREFEKANSTNFKHFHSADEIILQLKNQQLTDLAILIKGSRGMKLETILDAI